MLDELRATERCAYEEVVAVHDRWRADNEAFNEKFADLKKEREMRDGMVASRELHVVGKDLTMDDMWLWFYTSDLFIPGAEHPTRDTVEWLYSQQQT